MSEWLKEHAWKACVGETLPRVRIPLSPPSNLFSSATSWRCTSNGRSSRGGPTTRPAMKYGFQTREAEMALARCWASWKTADHTMSVGQLRPVSKPKVPSPRGKLNSFQLRSVLECVASQLEDVCRW